MSRKMEKRWLEARSKCIARRQYLELHGGNDRKEERDSQQHRGRRAIPGLCGNAEVAPCIRIANTAHALLPSQLQVHFRLDVTPNTTLFRDLIAVLLASFFG